MRSETARPWLQLLALTLGLSLVLVMLRLPAAWLLGAMAASIILSMRGVSPRVPALTVSFAQGMVGLLIATGLNADALRQMGDHLVLFVSMVLSVIAIAVALGALLYRMAVLPGTSALWGVFPGAASAMTLMAEAHGADVRFVALMQYLRVAIVVMVASTVMHAPPDPATLGQSGATILLHRLAAAPFDPLEFGKTVLLALVSVGIARRLRWPSGALLVPMVLGVTLQQLGWVRIHQPLWMMMAVYSVIGWGIGRRFTREVVRHAWRSLPWLLASIASLILACAALSQALSRWGGIDPLTAYLATSPGGLDAVAILAASAHVDLPFVMGLQTARLLTLMLLGPLIVRRMVRLLAGRQVPPRE